MSKIQVSSSTVEENFVFGSPPLLNGFTFNTCCSQEVAYKSNHDCCTYNIDCSQCCMSEENCNSDMFSGGAGKLNGFNHAKYSSCNGYSRSYSNYQSIRNNEQMVDSLNRISLNSKRTNQIDNGIKILEHVGLKVQQLSNINEPVFKKRKDLRMLKSALSSERFREVAMKFGDGGDDREILDSVHKTMKSSNLSRVTCLFCSGESQVYENFPVVDGTLFLSPLLLSRDCIHFVENTSDNHTRYMSYICVHCMEGKPKTLRCSGCTRPWNGSFFQIGTLYSYSILSAVPCCNRQVSCKQCTKSIIDVNSGEASVLYFSHFSKKTICPHCKAEDFHFVKSLSALSRGTNSQIA